MQCVFYYVDFFSFQIGKGMGDIFVDDYYFGECLVIGLVEGDLFFMYWDYFYVGNYCVKFFKV